MKKTVFVLTLVLLLVTFSTAHSQDANSLIPELAAELNLWRLELGLSPLVYNPTLESMAALQADYLLSLSDIPEEGEIHRDAAGRYARERSQLDPINWPTYGNPQFISLTEIAAIGSIRSAIRFWHESDIHNRSVINPNYREMGIAARSMDNLNGDTMFIVELAGRPDVLTALADPEAQQLYLSTETNEWTGDWIAAPTEYRLLDAERQSIGDWTPWALIVPLPADLDDTFYVEFRDANDRTTEAEVQLHPRWSVYDVEVEATEESPTRAPSSGGLVFATNTPIGTPAAVQPTTISPTATPLPVASATPTPTPVSVVLMYTNRLFTLIPASGPVNISDLTFTNGTLSFAASDWESVQSDLNLSALPANNCLQIWQRDAGEFSPPPQCSYVRSIVFLAQDHMFWTQGSFDVVLEGETLTTCQTDAGQCSVILPRRDQG
ncbi:MAG: CAP domain-containing protein [Anaerolineae bacterium]